jgi:hypothetical protein
MSDEPAGVAATWRDLLDPGRGVGADALERLQSLPPYLANPRVDEIQALGTRDRQMAAALLLAGNDACRPLAEQIQRGVELGVASMNRTPTAGGVLPRLGLLSLVSALECAGLAAQPYAGADAPAAVDGIVAGIEDLVEPFRHTTGLAAVATGRTALVPKCVRGGKLPARFKAGESFQFNVPGFVRYLAVAADKGAAAADVEPAWLDFVSAFPHKLAAETLDWSDLLWAARIYYHGFEKRPAADVVGALRALVTSS